MRSFPAPVVFRLPVLCLAFVFASLPARAVEEPLRPGDRIDVTLNTGAVFEYAKVIEVTKDSIMVANPQGVREFAATHLTLDLQARLPGATPPPASEPVAAPSPTPAPAPVAPAPVDLDALAAAISAKLDAQKQAAEKPSPAPAAVAAPAPQPVTGGVLTTAFAIGLLLIIPTLNVIATRSAILQASGAAVPMWILAIWLLPLIGSLAAFAALSRTAPPAKS